ncbi:GNAT family N-acetyltransferase [Oceanirhabdus seepicola]|uniref:GNAT family N-acetyltransferase n=1 Tax=Oceanirhabdus seepicola TaxID=2828781 RepID=A0A9J6P4N9_9CLOT|nr:GNAT family N-acetyltransferase [Oceanirhabdus seepicola]MCM1991539.1 GNAT family N-acetyltransferase [Oceanirhabdus seepicola]
MLQEDIKIENLLLNLEHIELVANWVYQEFCEGKPDRTVDFVINCFKNRNLNKTPISLIALIDNKCVGVVSIFDNDLETRPELTPWLAGLYVDPNYRCKGVADKLINAVLKICKNMNYDTVFLRTEHTANYYKKHGWTFVEDTTDEYGQETSVFMRKLI